MMDPRMDPRDAPDVFHNIENSIGYDLNRSKTIHELIVMLYLAASLSSAQSLKKMQYRVIAAVAKEVLSPSLTCLEFFTYRTAL